MRGRSRSLRTCRAQPRGIALLVAGSDSRQSGFRGAAPGLRHSRRVASNRDLALHSLDEIITEINLLAEP